MAFCSPRRFARREEEWEVVEFSETEEEERVNVIEGWEVSGFSGGG